MNIPLNEIICGDNVETMSGFPSDSIDLVVTSPPYGTLRTYGTDGDMKALWDFDGVAAQLWRVIKPGGVVVWVVADQTIDGSESGESFRQALAFKDLGFRLHDTMIYKRQGRYPDTKRYWADFEYMFVFSKGSPNTANLIKDRKSINAGKIVLGTTRNAKTGKMDRITTDRTCNEFKAKSNIWDYGVAHNNSDAIALNHPAVFPESLARDHILSWSNEDDIVLDPFSGSGTTAKMAKHNGRKYIGIEINPDYCKIAENRLEQNVLFN